MSIIRTFGDLAQEFLEQEVEAFELKLATEGNSLIVDENEWIGVNTSSDLAIFDAPIGRPPNDLDPLITFVEIV